MTQAARLFGLLLSMAISTPLDPAAAHILAQASPAPRPALTIVMPFESLGDQPALAWLSEASAILLADELRARGVVALDRAARLRVLAEFDLPSSARLSRASIIRISELIGATRVVSGTLALEKDDLVVVVRAVSLGPVRAEAPFEIRAPLKELFLTFARLADRLSPTGNADQGLSSGGVASLDAFERYVKGVLAGSPSRRIEFLQDALTRAPGDTRIRLALWQATTDAGDSEAALDVARSLPAESPVSRQAGLLAVQSLVALGRLQEAFELLTPLSEALTDAPLFGHLGLVQLRRGSPADSGRATYFFQQAVELTPQDPDALFNLGYAYWVEGDMVAATYWLREAVERRQTDAVARFFLGRALTRRGDAGEGAREGALARRMSRVVARWSGDGTGATVEPIGLERIGAMSTMTRSVEFEARLRAAAGRMADRLGHHHVERGRALFEAGRDDEALEELDRAIRLAPPRADAFILAGRLHLRAGRTADALELLTLALWIDGGSSTRLAPGAGQLRRDELAAARGEVERAITLTPTGPDATALLERMRAREAR